MFNIRQNSTHKVTIGPCVAVGDGFTPVTTLSVSTADEAEAILHDNATVVSISGYTFAAIASADGYYHLTLQSGITGTVGHLTIVVNDDSLCLPLKADFTVMEEAAYDSMYATSAFGPLQSTVSGRSLDVTATGAAGIDWANVEGQGSSVDLSATDIQLVDTVTTYTGNTPQTADHTAAIADIPTVSEFNARTLVAANYFDPTTDAVANVTLVATTTTNMDMRGTEGANTVVPDNDGIAAIEAATGVTLPAQIAALNDVSVTDILTTQMTEAYAADGTAPTLSQALFMVQQMLGDFSIAGTTLTMRRLDGSTTAATFTLDDGTDPTAITRAS